MNAWDIVNKILVLDAARKKETKRRSEAVEEYLIMAEAHWEEGYDHPSGHRSAHRKKSRKFFTKFEKANSQEAQDEARRLLVAFEMELPQERQDSMSWCGKPKITSVTFAKILQFSTS